MGSVRLAVLRAPLCLAGKDRCVWGVSPVACFRLSLVMVTEDRNGGRQVGGPVSVSVSVSVRERVCVYVSVCGECKRSLDGSRD